MTLTAYERATKQMNENLVLPLRQKAKGRLLFSSIYRLDLGKQNIDYDVVTDMSDAIVTYTGVNGRLERDGIKTTNTTLRCVQIIKGFEVEKSRVLAFESEGKDLPMASARSALQQVMEAEDDVLIQGWAPDGTAYTLSGLYQSAGNTTAGSSFGTAGNPLAAVAAAFALLYADGIDDMVNYNLVLNPTQYGELVKSTIQYVGAEWPEVMRVLNPNPSMPKGMIYWSNDITDGTGLMSPVDPAGDLIQLVMDPRDAHIVLGTYSELGDDSPVVGHCINTLAPLIKQSNSLCTITGI